VLDKRNEEDLVISSREAGEREKEMSSTRREVDVPRELPMEG